MERDLRAEFAARRRRGAVVLDDETRGVVAEIVRTRSLDEAFDRLAADDSAHQLLTGEATMTHKKKTDRTKTRVVLTDADITRIADEVAVTDYDVSLLKRRRRSRPALGDGPTEIVPARIDRELVEAMDACAEHEHSTRGEVIRKALRRYLARDR